MEFFTNSVAIRLFLPCCCQAKLMPRSRHGCRAHSITVAAESLSRPGDGLPCRHRYLSDHACDRDASCSLRALPVGCDELFQGIRRGPTAQPRANPRSDRVTYPRAMGCIDCGRME